MCGGARTFIRYVGYTTSREALAEYLQKQTYRREVLNATPSTAKNASIRSLMMSRDIPTGIHHIVIDSPYHNDIKRMLRCFTEVATSYGTEEAFYTRAVFQEASCATAVTPTKGYAVVHFKASEERLREWEESYDTQHFDYYEGGDEEAEVEGVRLHEDDYTHDVAYHRGRFEHSVSAIRQTGCTSTHSEANACLVNAHAVMSPGSSTWRAPEDWVLDIFPHHRAMLSISSNTGEPCWETPHLMGVIRSLKRVFAKQGIGLLVPPKLGTNPGEGHHCIDSLLLYREGL
jgi:hypothetical protein